MITTKVTWLGSMYGCRVFMDGVPFELAVSNHS